MIKKFIIFIYFVLYSGLLYSQNIYKIGHINSQELIDAMPESVSARNQLENHINEIQKQLELMQAELNKKYKDYTKNRNNYSDAIRQVKESELQDIDNRIQLFQSSANEDIEKRKTELFKPVLDKAQKAITDVAKENKFTYILDLSNRGIVFQGENSIDILPLVKKKIGIK